MKKLDRVEIDCITSEFKDFDKLLEPGVNVSGLGYKSIAVSIFDHWLTCEEYDEMEYLFNDQEDNMLINRAKMIASFPNVYLYDLDEKTDNDILYKYNNKEELYNYILRALREQQILDFVSYNPNMTISITPDLTDLYYTKDPNICNLIHERAYKFNLKSFIDNRK